MTKKEKTFELRNNTEVHYNCAQSVFVPFAPEAGLSDETANAVMTCFGGGMGIGSVCGAITGALAAMGALDLPMDKRMELMDSFREKFGHVDCERITEGLTRGTPEMKARCGQFIEFCVDFVCRESGLE